MPAKPIRPLRTGPKRTTADAIRDAELRSGRAARVVSLSEFQNLTGYDRGTVSRWIERGCPVEGKGAKGATLVDIRAVMDWREEEARADERRKIPESTVDTGSSDPDAELKREQIKFQKIKTAQLTGILVPTSVVELTYATCLNIVRQTVMGLPGRVERDLLGFPVSVVRKAKTDMTIQCRAALKEARGSMDEAIRKATKQRLSEIGADEDEEFDDSDVFADLADEEDGDGEA